MSSRRDSRSRNSTSDAGLAEQLKLLTLENERLRTIIASNGLSDAPPSKLSNEAESTANKKVKRQSTTTAIQKIKSPVVPVTPSRSNKGCTCKRDCSTKSCGCVKKNIPCTEFCKCGHEICQNLEPDKENTNETDETSKNRDHRINSEGSNESESPKNTKTILEPAKTTKKNIAKKDKAVKKKRNVRISSDDVEEESEEKNQPIDEPEPQKSESIASKNKKKVESKKKSNVGSTNKRNRIVSDDEEEETDENDDSNADFESEESPANEKMKNFTTKINYVEAPENVDNATSSSSMETQETGTKEEMRDHRQNEAPTNEIFGKIDNLIAEAEENFNPMKPRRQLSRSPLTQRTQSNIPKSLEPSDKFLSVPLVKEEPEEETPPPAVSDQEIKIPVVDWNEHLANLVPCRKCNRTFNPDRIEIHEARCKKI